MPKIKYCVGIDIASSTYTASVGQIPWKLVIKPETFENAEDGYGLLLEWLEKHHLLASETIVCMGLRSAGSRAAPEASCQM